jgi:putative membrane protein
MASSLSHLFSRADLERITREVKDAESKTAGEIVPYVVDASDSYEDALWRGGLISAILVLAFFVLIRRIPGIWLPFGLTEIVLAALASTVAGMLLVSFIPALKRVFAGSDLMERRVSQRAAEAFISEEVFQTRDRTGILIFISLLEHKVLVVGDTGINAKVKQEEWEGVVERVVKGIRSGRPAEGLIEGIRMCGDLLQREGVTIRPGDTNELPNKLRTGASPNT